MWYNTVSVTIFRKGGCPLDIRIERFNKREVLQYLNWRGSEIPADIDAMIADAMEETLRTIRPKYTWRSFRVQHRQEPYLPELELTLPGRDVAALLEDCDRCVLFAATLGAEWERLMHGAQARHLSRAVVLDCCGSAAIEAVCDQAEEELYAALPDAFFTDRFSPGYGDLPLELQRPITAVLDTARQIGLTLTDSCILIPGKSVTAIIGLADRPQTKRFRGCAYCSMFERCTYRKAGKFCGRI